MIKRKKINTEPWYAIKCVFQHKERKNGPRQRYEERIILVKSNGFDNAIKKAKNEAKRYAKECNSCVFTGYINAYHLFDKNISDMIEVFSDIRQSKMNSD